MDLIKLRIPATFILERGLVSWREVRFGLLKELLNPAAPVDLAGEQVARLAHPPSVLIELAGAERDAPTQDLVDQLADREPAPSESEVRDTWLYLVLAWIYEHQDGFPDPLQVVEQVYADFGYPAQIAGFVRYMPMEGPSLGGREANERRLYDQWKEYLEQRCKSMGRAAS